VEERIVEYRERRDLAYNLLREHFDVIQPDGSFYIFPQLRGLSGVEFVERAIRNNVLVIPGRIFSERDTNFRLSFAAPLDVIKRGIEILIKCL
jgi:aspartate aminotransferase/aminotransferase